LTTVAAIAAVAAVAVAMGAVTVSRRRPPSAIN
jgi:hypothetical protein